MDQHISGCWPRSLTSACPRTKQSIPDIADDARKSLRSDLRCRRYSAQWCSLSMLSGRSPCSSSTNREPVSAILRPLSSVDTDKMQWSNLEKPANRP